jgi:hypothetical protein
MRFRSSGLLTSLVALGWVSVAPAAGMSEGEAIKNALSAAPEAVAKGAAVMLSGGTGR